MSNEIKNFIIQQQMKGVVRDEIEKQLLQDGWSQQQIWQAFEEVDEQSERESTRALKRFIVHLFTGPDKHFYRFYVAIQFGAFVLGILSNIFFPLFPMNHIRSVHMYLPQLLFFLFSILILSPFFYRRPEQGSAHNRKNNPRINSAKH